LSEGIVFCRSSEDEEGEEASPAASNLRSSSTSDSKRTEQDDEEDQATKEQQTKRIIQINTLYIQMEFCEKKTLRDSIDSGLYRETSKVWRMFR
jgi:translation initiation factor 2-alpha kinase 4